MLTDHSKTYRLNDIRNIAHVMRLRGVLRTLSTRVKNRPRTYADYGCSNGFITSKVAECLSIPHVTGFDSSENVDVGAHLHPQIRFQRLDLNVVQRALERCDLVTCLETLEHVGNIASAVENVCRSRAPSGTLLITVPIEIGWIGFFKYLVKRFMFRYDLPLSCNDRQYAAALLRGERIGRFRAPAPGYGTHFGFDYRDVDELVARHASAPVEIWNAGTTRFYFISEA
jgi:2-polyprenyl-3-methyl-5-hydroxy-6-metoxy-1,4-benzoquinol methylase